MDKTVHCQDSKKARNTTRESEKAYISKIRTVLAILNDPKKWTSNVPWNTRLNETVSSDETVTRWKSSCTILRPNCILQQIVDWLMLIPQVWYPVRPNWHAPQTPAGGWVGPGTTIGLPSNRAWSTNVLRYTGSISIPGMVRLQASLVPPITLHNGECFRTPDGYNIFMRGLKGPIEYYVSCLLDPYMDLAHTSRQGVTPDCSTKGLIVTRVKLRLPLCSIGSVDCLDLNGSRQRNEEKAYYDTGIWFPKLYWFIWRDSFFPVQYDEPLRGPETLSNPLHF